MKNLEKNLDSWTIDYTPEARKLIKKLDKSIAREIYDYMREIAKLEDVRTRGKGLKSNLAGLWRYRVRDYRVICRIEDNRLLVLVLHVGKREIVYDI